MQISIITVVYNNVNNIEDTILNVLKVKENYKNLEYLVIDGGSSDGTVDVIQKYQSGIDFWMSEPDEGIYDAMNKGITNANAEWIIFMNSGDLFYDNGVLNTIFDENQIERTDIIYGKTKSKNTNRTIIPPKKVNKSYFFANTICHQSIFFNKKLFNELALYDLNYKIISDRDHLFRSCASNAKFKYVDTIISIWDEEGFSNDNILLFKKEVSFFRKQNFNFIERCFLLFESRFRNLLIKT